MIVKDNDAIKRLNSPMNLINRLKNVTGSRNNAMQLFGIGRFTDKKASEDEPAKLEAKLETLSEEVTVTFNPFNKKEESQTSLLPQLRSSSLNLPQETPASDIKLDNILDNTESKIRLGLAHDNALDLLNRSVEMLSAKLDDVRADRLPTVIAAASKTVESIRKERLEASKNEKDQEVHFHFYTPTQKPMSEFEVIDV
jgi:hypothetical protein